MRGIVSAVLLAFAAVAAFADCPDSYWDCLIRVESGGGLVPSGGGLVYGNCWRGWKCRPCDSNDATNATYILDKCNLQVIECGGRCEAYADLPNCCNGAAARCGSLESPEQVASACAGTTPLRAASTAAWRRLQARR
ncbi:hypothetical protein HXX76_012869 [Chlamydomonas incerta]|uniref:Uncharacterized protein n=1 Tax=Chlamydomonas incerta TaxID=51695 RepID=A0A835SGI8_CHLIN|nr:hypothetical protein HXX76_012869 [Chlamydomonas incerta]|eukprot:KAG2426817.1 hypothetical protein HXX76_012869 [Chlamydomonas incerta]